VITWSLCLKTSRRFSRTESCPKLRTISIRGTGTDNVDLATARKRGTTVCSTAGLIATTAAEHTIALLLAAARNISSVDAALRLGLKGVDPCFQRKQEIA